MYSITKVAWRIFNSPILPCKKRKIVDGDDDEDDDQHSEYSIQPQNQLLVKIHRFFFYTLCACIILVSPQCTGQFYTQPLAKILYTK